MLFTTGEKYLHRFHIKKKKFDTAFQKLTKKEKKKEIAFQKEKALIGLYELILELYTFFKYIQTLIGLYQLTEY